MGRCHNCDKYFIDEQSSDGGATCCKKCSKEYIAYLNAPIEE